MANDKIIVLTDFEVGEWIRERVKELPDPKAREGDRLLRLGAALQQARFSIDLKLREIAGLQEQLKRYRDSDRMNHFRIKRLEQQLFAREQARAKARRPRAGKRKESVK